METAKADFLKTINEQYHYHCKSKEKTPNTQDFLEYLMERNLINDLTIKRFVVVNAYPEALNNLGIKRTAVWEIEEKYDIPESTIKVYLKRFQNFFRLSID